MGRRVAGLLQLILDLVFPPRCVGCGQVDHEICPRCRESIAWLVPPLCSHCSRPIVSLTPPSPRESHLACRACLGEPLGLDGVWAVAQHSGVVRRAVHALKYEGRTSLARPLAVMMERSAREGGPMPVDGIAPVPLHPRRLRERGYNQATVIARELARITSLPILEDVLVRSRATKTQTELSAAERCVNVAGAFSAEPSLAAGRAFLLIDDVCTTGSTLQACGDALRRAGADRVYALTLTRAHWDLATGVAQDGDADGATRIPSYGG